LPFISNKDFSRLPRALSPESTSFSKPERNHPNHNIDLSDAILDREEHFRLKRRGIASKLFGFRKGTAIESSIISNPLPDEFRCSHDHIRIPNSGPGIFDWRSSWKSEKHGAG
jgi:hypothetical protein